jgi:hypothetical protein
VIEWFELAIGAMTHPRPALLKIGQEASEQAGAFSRR